MTYHKKLSFVADANLAKIRNFLSKYEVELARSAHTLGGRAASARVFLLCEAVRDTVRLTRAQGRQLVDLHRLLTLQNVGDPDRIESALFAEIDPASPFVEECCLLADKLETLLREISSDVSARAGWVEGTERKKLAA